MEQLGYCLFDTAIGRCGMVWSARGIAGVQLPEKTDAATRNRVLRRFPAAREGAPVAAARGAIADIVALLAGETRDLAHIAIDIEAVPDFNRRVYALARAIPAGATRSYGDLANGLGDRSLARDVAKALGENPVPIIVPCHRVMAAGGKTGGFSASGGVATKLRLLSIEGAQPGGNGGVDGADGADAPMLFDRLPLVAAPRRRA